MPNKTTQKASISQFTFKKLTLQDWPLLLRWFQEPHVKKWWPTPEENELMNYFLEKIRSKNTFGYVVLLDNIPIGYIQYYHVDQQTEKTGNFLPPLPEKTIGTDQFIGNPHYIGKGYGTLFIKQFINEIRKWEPQTTTIIVDPDPENIAAIKCYEKVGFIRMNVYDQPSDKYLLMRYDLSPPSIVWNTKKIDPISAQQLIENQFPSLKPAHLEYIGQGFDNIAYRTNQVYVFRFPCRQLGADLITKEWNVLPKLAKTFPVSIPQPLFYGNPIPDFQWPFIGYNYVEGQSADKAQLTIEERTNIAKPLALFLKTLHSIHEKEAINIGAELDTNRKLDIPYRWLSIWKNIEKIRALNIFNECDMLFELLIKFKNLQDNNIKVLVHGDLYSAHMLINQQRELSGIIDWGDVCVGNRAIDLQILFNFLPPSAHDLFFSIYGKIDINTRQLALFRALLHTSYVILYSHDSSNKNLLQESLLGLRFIVQEFYKISS